ncbi:response regulator [Gloeocapsa sp. PCC 73106]|uniref:response regulator n=1 Tax=Gloeocapsa sp. PCC 73106 TaxID=102232 RepID=UPI0002ABBA17|nr:response regulator [Gloeocapsa sp. PCC 73106]ELR96288.1 response regulator with CheY-like receiver, AAA-type ATPase, and DNA-binding domains [Gloeocapsa sp. PCC 73106]
MANRKILVIDDSRVIRRCVKDMLPEGQFEVLEAEDGAEGWNLIRSTEPNLIMLDFFLPKMSGWDVYQEIQKQQQLKAIPLVLMSGRKEEVTGKIQEPFVDFAFVEKPFDQKQLIEAIKDAMQKAKKHAVAKPAAVSGDPQAMAAEIQALKVTIVKMQEEMKTMKKQFNQVVQFIKQKLG